MANVNFARSSLNLLANATTVRVVIPGGTIVALQNSSYPVTNLANVDRYSVWDTGGYIAALGSNLDVYVQFILASPVIGSIAHWGWSGMRLTRPSTTAQPTNFLSGVSMQYSVQAIPVGDPVNATWVDTATINSSTQNVDGWTNLASATPNSVTGVQFKLADIVRYAGVLNSMLIGYFGAFRSNQIYDLGATFIYSPGSSRVTNNVAQARIQSANGAIHVTDLSSGYASQDLVMLFNKVNSTTRGQLLTIANETKPIFYRDSLGAVFNILPVSGGLTVTHVWGPPDLWDIEFRAVTLP